MKEIAMKVLILGAATLSLCSAPAEARGRDTVLVIGKSASVEANEAVDEVVVIGGSVDIKGEVGSDVVVIGGKASLSGKVGGDMVVVGGAADLGPTALIEGEAVVVGGELDADPAARVLGGKMVSFSPLRLGAFQRLGDWIRGGLMYGRPLAPASSWAWYAAAAFLLVNLFIAAVFPRPIELCGKTLEERPARALLAGALGMALLGPASVLLVLTVAGIAVIPVLLCGALAAAWIGKIAVFRHVGAGIGERSGLRELGRPLPAVAAGMAALYLLYAVPLLGLAAWAAATAFGFGAAILALAQAFRKESGADSAPATTGGSSIMTASETPQPIQPSGSSETSVRLPRAGFGERLGAIAIDAFLFMAIGAMIRVVSLGWLTWAIYQIGMWTWKGTTIGGIVFGLRGERMDGRPMDLGVAVVRHLAGYLSSAVLGLGFLWAAWDAEGQTWHDKIAGTVVVKVPRGQPLI